MHLCQHTQNSTSSVVMNLEKTSVWETYTGFKWWFKNNHKNENLDQILSVHSDRKNDNFYRITKLIGDSNFFIVVVLFFLAILLSLTISRAARPGRQVFFIRNWAGLWKQRVSLHTCFFPTSMSLRELVIFPSFTKSGIFFPLIIFTEEKLSFFFFFK